MPSKVFVHNNNDTKKKTAVQGKSAGGGNQGVAGVAAAAAAAAAAERIITNNNRRSSRRATRGMTGEKANKKSVAETYRDIYHAVSAPNEKGLQQQAPNEQPQPQQQNPQPPERETPTATTTTTVLRATTTTTRTRSTRSSVGRGNRRSKNRSPAEQYREIYQAVGGGGGGLNNNAGNNKLVTTSSNGSRKKEKKRKMDKIDSVVGVEEDVVALDEEDKPIIPFGGGKDDTKTTTIPATATATASSTTISSEKKGKENAKKINITDADDVCESSAKGNHNGGANDVVVTSTTTTTTTSGEEEEKADSKDGGRIETTTDTATTAPATTATTDHHPLPDEADSSSIAPPNKTSTTTSMLKMRSSDIGTIDDSTTDTDNKKAATDVFFGNGNDNVDDDLNDDTINSDNHHRKQTKDDNDDDDDDGDGDRKNGVDCEKKNGDGVVAIQDPSLTTEASQEGNDDNANAVEKKEEENIGLLGRGRRQRKVKPPSWLSNGGLYETEDFTITKKRRTTKNNKRPRRGTGASASASASVEETDDENVTGSTSSKDVDESELDDSDDQLSSSNNSPTFQNENEDDTITTKKKRNKSSTTSRRNVTRQKSDTAKKVLSATATAGAPLTKEEERKIRAKERRKKPKFPNSHKKINGLTPAMAIAIERTKAMVYGPEIASSIPLPRVETTPLNVTTPPQPLLPPSLTTTSTNGSGSTNKMTSINSSLLTSKKNKQQLKKRPRQLQPQSLEKNKRLKEMQEAKQAKKEQEQDERMQQQFDIYYSEMLRTTTTSNNNNKNVNRNKTTKLLNDGRAVTVIEARFVDYLSRTNDDDGVNNNDVIKMVVPDHHNFTPDDVPLHPLLLQSTPSTPLRFVSNGTIVTTSKTLSSSSTLLPTDSEKNDLPSPSSPLLLLSSPSSVVGLSEQKLSSSLEQQKLQWEGEEEEEEKESGHKKQETDQRMDICQKTDSLETRGTNTTFECTIEAKLPTSLQAQELGSTLVDPLTKNPADGDDLPRSSSNESLQDERMFSTTASSTTVVTGNSVADEGKQMSAVAGNSSSGSTHTTTESTTDNLPLPEATKLDDLIFAVDQVNRASSALAMMSLGDLSPDDFVDDVDDDDDDVVCRATPQPAKKVVIKKRISSNTVTTKKVIKKKKVVKVVSDGKNTKKKSMATSKRPSTSSYKQPSLYKPVPAKHKDHISTLNLRAGQRVELFLNKVPRLGTLLEGTIDQYGWQKSRVKVRWDPPAKDKNEEMKNKHADSGNQEASKSWAISRPDGDGSFDWADTIALREPVHKVTTKLNNEIPTIVHTTAKKKDKIPAESKTITTKKNEPASLFASRVSEPKTEFQDYGKPVVPTEEELRENSKPRARDALLNWYRRLEDLRQYRIKHGHTNVPQKYPENPPLGIWVNKMRFEKRALDKGEPSKITPFRIKLLEDAGFIWAKKKGQHAWEEQFQNMLAFKRLHGHVNVPTKSSDQRALGRWVSTQRSVYKRWKNGEFSAGVNSSGDGSTSSFAAENLAEIEHRIRRLDEIGFTWSLAPQGDDARSGAEASLSSDEN